MKGVLESERLRLRALELADLDFVAEMLGDARVMQHYPKCLTRTEAALWIDRQRERYARDGHGLWLAELRSSGEPVGQVGLIAQAVRGERLPEVGYLLHHAWWGMGYATEAACAVRDWAFDVLESARIISLIRPQNEPSRRVAHRVGMQLWTTTIHAGFPHDVFSMTRVERGR